MMNFKIRLVGSLKRSTIILALINVILLSFVSVHILGICRVVKLEGRSCYDFGDGLAYELVDLPLIAFSFLLDIIWTIIALKDVFRRDYRSIFVLFVITILWIVTCSIVWHMSMLE